MLKGQVLVREMLRDSRAIGETNDIVTSFNMRDLGGCQGTNEL